jgi:hypothetical protein
LLSGSCGGGRCKKKGGRGMMGAGAEGM